MKRLLLFAAFAIVTHAQTITKQPALGCVPNALAPCGVQYRLSVPQPANQSVVAVRYVVTAVVALNGQTEAVTGVIQRFGDRGVLWADFTLSAEAYSFTVRTDDLVVSGSTITTIESGK